MKQRMLFLLIMIHAVLPARDQERDSLQGLIRTAKHDTSRVNALNALGRMHIVDGEYIAADSVLDLALKASRAAGYLMGEANALTNSGVLYWYQDDYPQSLEHYFAALKIVESLGDKHMIARSLANIGLVYSSQGDRAKALQYYQEALELKIAINDKKASAIILGNMGEIYKQDGNYRKALEYFFRAQKMAGEIGSPGLIALYISWIGNVKEQQGEHADALKNYLEAQQLAKEINDQVLMAATGNSIGGILIKEKRYTEAEEYLQASLALSEKLGDLNQEKDAHMQLYNLYSTQSQWLKALDHFREYTSVRDSIFNEEKTKKTVRSEMNFAFDKKQTAEKVLQAKKDAIASQELKQQKMQRNYSIAGFALMVLVALLILRGYRQKQKANRIIAMQKEEVEKQKDLIEEKSREITDSIIYAKRLQDAILPPESYINEHLPDNFILYKPKDIVAGDFYWMEHTGDLTFIAVADCTGHGVPGAMVSVICSNALSRAVVEFGITDPGKILDKARELLLDTFSKSDKDVKDGMDISLCSISSSGEVQWAGAYNPLWYWSQGEMHEITANKQPIGKTDQPLPFRTHTLPLSPGDILYLFTDGYADQFGGEKGKKFKYKPLKELLISTGTLSVAEQRFRLEQAFHSWKGHLEQVDDVCIIGVRL